MAQWSEDPFNNLVLANRSGEQIQPKIVATNDGFSYVSWMDNTDGGYDVYLQRLNASGKIQWAQNGVLVASRNFSSTQDYGLSIDTSGNALMTFRDDRSGLEKITANKINQNGQLIWGDSGVSVSGDGGILANPKITGTSDDQAVIIWTEGTSVFAQRLNTDGTKLWGEGVIVSDPNSTFISSDIQASNQGTVIVSMVESNGFSSPKHLYAQKLATADGQLLWGSDPLPIYNQAKGSLQFGNFPAFITDDMGGAIFTWYTASPALNCRVQRIDSNGLALFTANGVETSINNTQLRVSPNSSFNPVTEEIYTFWVELDNSQSQSGIYGQKFDNTGNRQWSDNGKEIVTISNSIRSFIQNSLINNQPMVSWINSYSFNNDVTEATYLDVNGEFIWQSSVIEIGSNSNNDSRLNGTANSDQFGMYVWTENEDVKAQNLNIDGSLGVDLIFANDFDSM